MANDIDPKKDLLTTISNQEADEIAAQPQQKSPVPYPHRSETDVEYPKGYGDKGYSRTMRVYPGGPAGGSASSAYNATPTGGVANQSPSAATTPYAAEAQSIADGYKRDADEIYSRPAPNRRSVYRDLLDDSSEDYGVLSPEQEAKMRKRERNQRTLAAVTDGLMALGNVIGTSAGAGTPNMYDGKTLSEAQRARWDALRAHYDANKQNYALARQKAAEQDEKQYKDDLELYFKQQGLDAKRAKDAAEENWKLLNAMMKADEAKQKGDAAAMKMELDRAKLTQEKMKAENLPLKLKEESDLRRARTSAAYRSNRGGGGRGRSGSSSDNYIDNGLGGYFVMPKGWRGTNDKELRALCKRVGISYYGEGGKPKPIGQLIHQLELMVTERDYTGRTTNRAHRVRKELLGLASYQTDDGKQWAVAQAKPATTASQKPAAKPAAKPAKAGKETYARKGGRNNAAGTATTAAQKSWLN